MPNIFQLLETGVEFTWDPEELTKNFKVVEDKHDKVISLPGQEPHWQCFKSGIYFSRNFNLAFPCYCKEVTDRLANLQNNVITSSIDSSMMKLFTNHKLRIGRVVLIKVTSGQDVKLHFDATRSYAINIGLKNSNTCLTHIYSGERVKDTLINEKNVKYTFQMNNGDVYLLATGQPHYVESLTNINENKDRYLVSYFL
jgi:hypothetical protein